MPALRHSLGVVASDLPLTVPGVWHADALGAGQLQVQSTGYGPLDAQLPGGGWPMGALSEVLHFGLWNRVTDIQGSCFRRWNIQAPRREATCSECRRS